MKKLFLWALAMVAIDVSAFSVAYGVSHSYESALIATFVANIVATLVTVVTTAVAAFSTTFIADVALVDIVTAVITDAVSVAALVLSTALLAVLVAIVAKERNFSLWWVAGIAGRPRRNHLWLDDTLSKFLAPGSAHRNSRGWGYGSCGFCQRFGEHISEANLVHLGRGALSGSFAPVRPIRSAGAFFKENRPRSNHERIAWLLTIHLREISYRITELKIFFSFELSAGFNILEAFKISIPITFPFLSNSTITPGTTSENSSSTPFCAPKYRTSFCLS